MPIDFDYDLEEIVSSGSQTISLRSAVNDYISAHRIAAGLPLAPVMWNREMGKTPAFFEETHLVQLAQLPEFRTA